MKLTIALLTVVCVFGLGCVSDSNRATKTAQEYLERSQMHVKEGRNDLALEDVNKAIELDPKNTWAYSKRSSVYLGLAATGMYFGGTNMSVEPRMCDLALADCSKAIDLEPTNADFYEKRGTILAFAGKYELGLADHTKAIACDPSNPWRYMQRAHFYQLWAAHAQLTGNRDLSLALANDELAMKDYSKAVELAPMAAFVYLDRAQFCMGTHPNLALADLKKAVELEPKSAYPHRMLATMIALRQRLDGIQHSH